MPSVICNPPPLAAQAGPSRQRVGKHSPKTQVLPKMGRFTWASASEVVGQLPASWQPVSHSHRHPTCFKVGC